MHTAAMNGRKLLSEINRTFFDINKNGRSGLFITGNQDDKVKVDCMYVVGYSICMMIAFAKGWKEGIYGRGKEKTLISF